MQSIRGCGTTGHKQKQLLQLSREAQSGLNGECASHREAAEGGRTGLIFMIKVKKRGSSILRAGEGEEAAARADLDKLRRQSAELETANKQNEKTSQELHKTIGQTHRGAHLAHLQTGKMKYKRPGKSLKFPIAGIGASAGGLEAVTQLLKSLPPDIGMAFVLVQHLDPTHESALSSLLSRTTEMPVMEARNNLRLEPNHLYVIPPNKSMGISARQLKLFPRRGKGREEHMPIDMFFRSLAEQEGSNAVGIVLSGSGAD